MHGFEEARLEYVNRLGNGAVHQLARYAREVDDIVMWWDSCPFVSQFGLIKILFVRTLFDVNE